LLAEKARSPLPARRAIQTDTIADIVSIPTGAALINFAIRRKIGVAVSAPSYAAD